ncbi:MAG: NADH-quinone oxidoreductase subunit NuoK [Ignavibacteriota bacterium]|jgi:NADH-quinone oxidoreductase subunit K|nr:NADH-quinone oxidoreductase subunit NuoK [Ignavibacteriota bacterium]
MEIGLNHYLVLSAILFGLGLFAMITRRNAILVLMGIELILNAANINLVAFSHFGGMGVDGQVLTIFVMILAVAEAAVALGIVLNLYNNFATVDVDEANTMKD